MSKALTTIDAHVIKGRDYLEQGDDYYSRAGAEFRAAREAAGGFTPIYRKALERAGVGESTERRAIQFAADPQAAVEHRKKDVAYQMGRHRATNSERKPAQEYNDLPREPASKGEIHEATRGFVAMIRKGAQAGDNKDWRLSRERRTVAFAHFKKLLEQSNLPQLMGMSPDDIIELIRTI